MSFESRGPKPFGLLTWWMDFGPWDLSQPSHTTSPDMGSGNLDWQDPLLYLNPISFSSLPKSYWKTQEQPKWSRVPTWAHNQSPSSSLSTMGDPLQPTKAPLWIRTLEQGFILGIGTKKNERKDANPFFFFVFVVPSCERSPHTLGTLCFVVPLVPRLPCFSTKYVAGLGTFSCSNWASIWPMQNRSLHAKGHLTLSAKVGHTKAEIHLVAHTRYICPNEPGQEPLPEFSPWIHLGNSSPYTYWVPTCP